MSQAVAAVIPARDEADIIAATVAALRGSCAEVIVVDDGSRDATAEVAGRAGARVVWSPRSYGKGAAATAGVRSVSADTDVVLLADADLGDTAAGLTVLVEELRDGADLAIGVFPPLSGGGFGMVKAAAADAIERATGRRVTEPLSGQRAMRIGTARRLLPFAPGFGMETRMTIDALLAGMEVREVPIVASHRPTGRGVRGFMHRGRQGADIARAVRGIPRSAM